jgi:hypothetical protein
VPKSEVKVKPPRGKPWGFLAKESKKSAMRAGQIPKSKISNLKSNKEGPLLAPLFCLLTIY